ncbi:sel1 repeat family protein [Massilia antarctica]|uniref:Sel1 repeat family protein n=1 Tax=Massilia antarctica TaxID=2765360 RepID=A0AA48WJR7_9BURK|nr:sel1 repeat family protein [Massilia antarctica]QPI52993.1 sel1 repeat family protein [Massilia antarctica]
MNILYHPLKCSGCAQEFPFPSIARAYTDLPQAEGRSATHFSQMLLLPVWCHQCEGASWVERIPAAREFALAAGLRRMLGRARHEGIDDDLLDLDDADFAWLYQHLAERQAPPFCVECGSTRIAPIDTTQRDTGLLHEACWDSPILFHGFPIGSIGFRSGRESYAHRFHDVTGQIAWTRLQVQGFLQYRLGAVLEVRRDDPCHAVLTSIIRLIANGCSERAIAALAPLVDAQVPAALGLLGALHVLGEGVAHSGTAAAPLLEKAKALGNACAAHNLASLYATGAPGLAQDTSRARQLFGDALAMGGQYEPDDFYAQDDYTSMRGHFYRPA